VGGPTEYAFRRQLGTAPVPHVAEKICTMGRRTTDHSRNVRPSPLVCLVTGASRGIGLETTLELERRGHRVYAGMRDPDRRNAEAAARISARAVVLQLDVTDDAAVVRALDEVVQVETRIDVVVNNAGFGAATSVEEATVEQARRIFDTNVLGPLRLICAAVPRMRSQGSGVVVQVSSLNGRLVPPLGGLYAASKFALEALSEALAYEVARFGVRVAIIEPGPYETGVWDALDIGPSLADGRSPYAPLFERTFPTFRSRALPNVREVAVAIADAVEDPATPLRVPVGMTIERFRERRRELDDEQFAPGWWERARNTW